MLEKLYFRKTEAKLKKAEEIKLVWLLLLLAG